MTITELFTNVETMLAGDTSLSQLANSLYLTVPKTYPCVCIDGLESDDDKLGTCTFNINLWWKASGVTNDLAMHDTADALKAALNAGGNISCQGYLSRHEPDHSLMRLMFPCTTYTA